MITYLQRYYLQMTLAFCIDEHTYFEMYCIFYRWDDTNESEVSGDHSTKYQVVDDWGEAHADITQTAIFRWNWKEDDSVPVKVAIEMPDIEAKTLGNVAIAGDRLIFIAYENGAARRLGVQYCVNRLTS